MIKLFVSVLTLITFKPDSNHTLIQQIKKSDIKYKDAVLAQSIEESGWFKSSLYRINKNAFGMRHNKRGFSIKANNGYAVYKSYEDSVKDFIAWQRDFIENHKIKTKSQYIQLIDRLYAKRRPKEYLKNIKNIMNDNKELMNFICL